MCGITGFFSFHPQSESRLSKITQSTDKLFLRGPDCGNVFSDNKVALGHRRLSIIDTSNAAAQPMSDVSGRYVIVFNGEIFNYQRLASEKLREMSSSQGGFKTTSDTEVLLYLLIHYQEKCLPWLSGFFAFAFYDKREQTLLLARDRYGKKPLLYYNEDSYFAFASEMKSLLAWDIPKDIDYTVLHQYLQLNYIPQPQSILKGCSKLKPGHYGFIHANGAFQEKPYYDITIRREAYQDYTYEKAKEVFIQKMDAAVQERMIADVPLGAFLSGGIDSSIIVALASRYTDQLNTFSIGYKDNAFFDETSYAKLVADKYKTNHTVFSLTNADFLEHVYDVLDYIDEPFADSSAIPVYILCKRTRRHVTVALSGDGGDEVFAGYNKHAAEWRIRQSSLANTLVNMGQPLWKILPKSRNHKLTNLFRQLHRFAEGSKLGLQERYWRWASFTSSQDAASLICTQLQQSIDYDNEIKWKQYFLRHIQSDDFNEVLKTDMNLVLLSDMLVKVDMMSMANSLEVRSPFLDYKVVDFAFGLPATYKVDNKFKKKIVQDAFREMLPPALYNRPKHGFEIPLLDWFKKELWSLIDQDLLSDKFIKEQQIFDLASIQALKKKLCSANPEDSHATIWALIVFQYWWKKYFC